MPWGKLIPKLCGFDPKKQRVKIYWQNSLVSKSGKMAIMKIYKLYVLCSITFKTVAGNIWKQLYIKLWKKADYQTKRLTCIYYKLCTQLMFNKVKQM